SAFDRQRGRFQRMRRIGRDQGQGSPIAVDVPAECERHWAALLYDLRGLVLIAVFPGEPDAERRNDQCGKGDHFAERDPPPPDLFFGGLAHRPPASNSRRGAASSQLDAIRLPTWSQSTRSPTTLIDSQVGM